MCMRVAHRQQSISLLAQQMCQTASTLVANGVVIVAFAELAGKGNAGEVLKPLPVDGVDVEPDDKWGEKPNIHEQRQNDEHTFAVLVEGAEGNVGQEGEGQQQAAEEAEDVGNVVDPRQQATKEEEEDEAKQLEKSIPWRFQHLPALKKLDKQAC